MNSAHRNFDKALTRLMALQSQRTDNPPADPLPPSGLGPIAVPNPPVVIHPVVLDAVPSPPQQTARLDPASPSRDCEGAVLQPAKSLQTPPADIAPKPLNPKLALNLKFAPTFAVLPVQPHPEAPAPLITPIIE